MMVEIRGMGGFKDRQPDQDIGEPVMGWVCSATPEELLLAAGLRPMRLYGFEARGAQSEAIMPTTFCAYVHGVLQAALEDRFRHLAGVVVVNSCDAMRRLADAWERFVGTPPVYRLDFPFRCDETAERHWTGVLNRFAAHLASVTGRSISQVDLQAAIDLMNQTRRTIQALDQLRASKNRPISGTDFADWAAKACMQDKKRFLLESSSLLEHAQSKNFSHQSGPRIVLGGCAANARTLVGLVEKSGALVVGDELCTGARHFHTLVDESMDPMLAVAHRYLRRPPCARRVDGGDYIGHVLDLVREARADGVVFQTLKFCDAIRWRVPRLADALTRQGIPFRHVERDGSAASWGPLETRLEAFVEMLQLPSEVSTHA
ncbi:MAG: 2-hydroxyacyl-CoA dehydratase subunit D [Desulfosoma sp.]|uniref:2-hydroxyacyl-CoA dehydratase subunit D n=1 Tax=Desulfosoma sp. TaxID=2603217 RepID=UPI00404B78C7